jgi:hypothetical protein
VEWARPALGCPRQPARADRARAPPPAGVRDLGNGSHDGDVTRADGAVPGSAWNRQDAGRRCDRPRARARSLSCRSIEGDLEVESSRATIATRTSR